jgi:uncharacterized protein YodC (DUF2158 family)
MKKKPEVGDLVRLHAGGPMMAISVVIGDGRRVLCQWFDREYGCWELHRETFWAADLCRFCKAPEENDPA